MTELHMLPHVQEAVVQETFARLSGLAKVDRDAALWAAAAWLEANGAGTPYLDMVAGGCRDSARFWAEVAHPHEVEAYVVAGIDRVNGTAWGSRQIKRLAGIIWKRMAPAERRAYVEWMAGL